MKEIYSKIWKLAKEYYLRGRSMDIDHIKWMMKEADLVCKQENIDDTLLLPLCILHDVGYSESPKTNPFDLDLRKAHMEKGKEIAIKILNEVGYDKEKIEKISYYVSVHDNWALKDNDLYKKDIILGVFNDLDYMWVATSKGFLALMGILGKDEKGIIKFLQENEKIINRPFSTKTTTNLYERYLNDRISEIR